MYTNNGNSELSGKIKEIVGFVRNLYKHKITLIPQTHEIYIRTDGGFSQVGSSA